MWLLNFLALPAAAFEKDHAHTGDEGFGYDDRQKDAFRVHADGNRQKICQRNFEQPEADEIDESGRERISRAVERLQHYHAVGTGDVAEAEDSKTGGGVGDDSGILREETDDGFREEDKDYADTAEEQHVVEACAPDGFFGA